MRHNKKFNHLGRTASHRSAMLSNMAVSLIKHKRITTTLAKAKALKKFVEPLITVLRMILQIHACCIPLFTRQRSCKRIVQRISVKLVIVQAVILV